MHDLVETKFSIGIIVKHKFLHFRGVIFDVDPEFNNSEEWYMAIPKEIRPRKDQPFYHLLAENKDIFYVAYVSEQNLLIDMDNSESSPPDINKIFSHYDGEKYIPHARTNN